MRVLVYFYNDQHWIHFRYAEFDALLRMHGLNPSDIYEKPADKGMTASSLQHSPFLIAELPSIEVAQSICKRSVLIRQILLLWDHTNNFEELASRVSACSVCNPATGVASACNSNHCHHSTDTDADINSKTFSVSIHTFGQSLSSSQKVGLRNSLPVSRFTGKVNLSNPELPVMLIMDFSSKHEFDKKAIVTPVEDINQINVAEGGEKIVYPKRVKTGGVGSQKSDDIVGVPCYFGLAIGFGGMKDEISKYDLKTRLFIGPTSLDHVLALIMSNLSYVDANSVVLDPFVGTASLLVAASHFKATCFGSDIDIRVLKGAMYAGKADRKVDKTKRDIIENFKHYGLQTPEILRLDNHLFEHHFESDHVLRGFYDAIITDPPYGIRAGARKSGRKDLSYEIPEHLRYEHCPHTQVYAVEEVMLDLLHTAAISLKLGGILSYLIPTPYDFNVEVDLPKHPCLALTTSCVQTLSSRHGRYCIVMTKDKEYTEELHKEFQDYKTRVLKKDPNEGFSLVISKLEKALSNDAFEDDGVVKIISNACQRRKNTKANKKATIKLRNKTESDVSTVVSTSEAVDI